MGTFKESIGKGLKTAFQSPVAFMQAVSAFTFFSLPEENLEYKQMAHD
jgi:hypothetical protein